MQFDADQHQDTFAKPLGRCRLRVNNVFNEFTKGGSPLLRIEFKAIEPAEHKNKFHSERFILEHDNPETVRIALGKLSTCSRALGMPKWDHERDLIGLTCEATIGPQKDNPDFNEVKSYHLPNAQKGSAASNPYRDSDVQPRNGQLKQSVSNMPDGRPMAPIADDDVPF